MELFVIFGIIISLFGLFICLLEDEVEYAHFILTGILLFVISFWMIWLSLTELKYESIEIRETTDFIYYVDDKNNIISLPSNTIDVVKVHPRKWSVNSYSYQIKLK